MIVFLNNRAAGGTAASKWRRIADTVRQRVEPDGLVVRDATDLATEVPQHIANGERTFVAAGGDGTVHVLANALLRLPEADRGNVSLGAIGLGSSNDFHKPREESASISGIPVRISELGREEYNAVSCSFQTTDGRQITEWFVVNASLGLVAEGNGFFNRGDPLLRILKRGWTDAAIAYAAIRTMLVHRNAEAQVTIDGDAALVDMTNLSLLLNPHFTGSYRYDTPVTPKSSYMCVNLWHGMNLQRKVRTFIELGKGRFLGLPFTSSRQCQTVSVESQAPMALELDGEVQMIRAVSAQLVPRALHVCG